MAEEVSTQLARNLKTKAKNDERKRELRAIRQTPRLRTTEYLNSFGVYPPSLDIPESDSPYSVLSRSTEPSRGRIIDTWIKWEKSLRDLPMTQVYVHFVTHPTISLHMQLFAQTEMAGAS